MSCSWTAATPATAVIQNLNVISLVINVLMSIQSIAHPQTSTQPAFNYYIINWCTPMQHATGSYIHPIGYPPLSLALDQAQPSISPWSIRHLSSSLEDPLVTYYRTTFIPLSSIPTLAILPWLHQSSILEAKHHHLDQMLSLLQPIAS